MDDVAVDVQLEKQWYTERVQRTMDDVAVGVQQEGEWYMYKHRVKMYLQMRHELADIKSTLDALRKQDLPAFEPGAHAALLDRRDDLEPLAEKVFQALKYDEKGNVKQMYKDLPDDIKFKMGDAEANAAATSAPAEA